MCCDIKCLRDVAWIMWYYSVVMRCGMCSGVMCPEWCGVEWCDVSKRWCDVKCQCDAKTFQCGVKSSSVV